MTDDVTTRPSPPTPMLEPAASLMSVRVRRRKQPVAPSGKRGDLTDGAAPAVLAPAPVPAPSAPVLVLPPPRIEPELRQELLPLAEILLPELAASGESDEPELPLAATHDAVGETDSEPEAEIESAPEAESALEGESAFERAEAAEAADAAEDTSQSAGEIVELFATPETLELLPLVAEESVAEPPPAAEPEPLVTEPEAPRPLLSLVETPPEAEPDPDEPAPVEPLQAEPAPAGEPDLLDYWDSLRGGRDFPALDDLDRGHVGASWPNTILLAVGAADLPRITRLGESDGEIEYTATVIDWIMSRGRQSAKRAEPMEEEHRFPVSTGSARYRLLLLPLSSYGLNCDHVLCQLSRGEEVAAATGWKRWFAL